MKKPLKVVLEPGKARFHCSVKLMRRLKKYFRYRPKGYFFSPKYRSGLWDGWVNLMKWGSVPIGLFLERLPTLRKLIGRKVVVTDKRVPLQFRSEYPAKIQRNIRPYQQEAVEAMIQSGYGIILSSTGSGKSFTAAAYLSRLVGWSCFVVDELTLLQQTKEEFEAQLGYSVGIVGGGEFSPKRITIATAQTLQRQRKSAKMRAWFKKIQVLFFDEVHLALNDRSFSIVQAVKPQGCFGLTATLQLHRKDILFPAAALTGPKLFEYNLNQGQREGVLSKGVVCRLLFEQKHPTSLDYIAEYRSNISHNKRRNTCIEKLVREAMQQNRRTIVLVERLKHLKVLSKRLADLNPGCLSGAFEQSIRKKAKQDMDAGKLNLIIATRIFAKGINILSADTVIDATGLKSADAAQQRLGRAARQFETKRGFIHIDVSDNGFGNSNYFSSASAARVKALKKLRVPIVKLRWEGNAKEVYQKCLRARV